MTTTRYPAKPPKGLRVIRDLVRFYGVVLALAIVAHFIWTRIELHRYANAANALRQQGEPGNLADLNRPPKNDPDNPVVEWRAAFGAIDEGLIADDSFLYSTSEFQFPLTSDQAAKLHTEVDRNRSALAHVDAAASKTGPAEWNVQFVSPAIDTLMPDLTNQRIVYMLIAAAALDAHQRGDDREAVGRIEQVIAAQRDLSRYPGVIGHMVADAGGEMVVFLVSKIAPDLSIQPSDQSESRSASIDQIKR